MSSERYSLPFCFLLLNQAFPEIDVAPANVFPSRQIVEHCPIGAIVTQGEPVMDKYNLATLSPEDVIWETKVIAIEGMTCDNCVKQVTRALQGVSGVKAVEVDRENARATVTYDNTKTDIPALYDS